MVVIFTLVCWLFIYLVGEVLFKLCQVLDWMFFVVFSYLLVLILYLMYACEGGPSGQGRGKRLCEGYVKVVYELSRLSKLFIDKSAI